MRKDIFMYSLLLTVLIFCFSCTADKEEIDTCGLDNITYSSDIQPLLEVSCVSCHNSTNSSGGINLDSYESASSAANSGKLLGAVRQEAGFSAMPPSGKLDSCQIARIEEWIDSGLPE